MATHLDLVHKLFGPSFRISRWYLPGTHDGIDLPAQYGTPVYALASGRVSYAKDSRLDPHAMSSWAAYGGNVVNIDVSPRYTTQYAHLSAIAVKPGANVAKGQLIGYVGDTGGGASGSSSGGWLIPGAEFGRKNSHVHFGLWDHQAGKMVEPTAFLTAAAAGWNGAIPDSMGPWTGPGFAGGVPIVNGKPLGAWNDIITFPTGKTITPADVDAMMAALVKHGYFGDPDTGGGLPDLAAYNITKATLTRVAVGKQWGKPLQDELAAALGQDATNAGDAGGLKAIADIAGKLTDPGNWVRILALFAGAAIFAFGAYGVVRSTAEVNA